MSRLLDAICVSKFVPKRVASVIRSCWLLVYGKTAGNQTAVGSTQFKPNALNCRVKVEKDKKNSEDIFSVEICGLIQAPRDLDNTAVQISVMDVTGQAKPVHTNIKEWQTNDSPVFCYNANLGRLPDRTTVLSDWMVIAHLNTGWLILPRRGKRNLQFNVSIQSSKNSQSFASAAGNLLYDNQSFGYIDLHENTERTKTMAVSLAFAVSAAGKKISNREIEIIKKWAQSNIDISSDSGSKTRKLNKALCQAIRFFRQGNTISIYETCCELAEIAPLAERYDILELCLDVVGANGIACEEHLNLLKKLTVWLEVDQGRFRSMMEQFLPAEMHEVEDVEIILGITREMTNDMARKCINKEYRKWNARVTNSDSQIKAQANHMLQFIARTRNEYLE